MTSQREPGELRASQGLLILRATHTSVKVAKTILVWIVIRKKPQATELISGFESVVSFIYWYFCIIPSAHGVVIPSHAHGEEVAGHLYTRSSRSWLLRCLCHSHLFLLPGSFSVVLSHN